MLRSLTKTAVRQLCLCPRFLPIEFCFGDNLAAAKRRRENYGPRMRPPQEPPATTYTSIPLSPGDVISQSIHNLTAAVSSYRPWQEFVALGAFNRPESLSSIVSRARTNGRYFFVNYSLVVGTCAALALIGSPVKLLVVIAILLLWLLFHFFREDPVVIWGKQVSDRMVLVFLVLVSVLAAWLTRCVLSLVLGIGVGLLVCVAHAVFRNPDGLFLDEDEAVSGGLIGSDRR